MRRIFGIVTLMLSFVMAALLCPRLHGEELDKSKWQSAYLSLAKQMELKVADGQHAELVPTPFFSWANPVREGRTQGDFFVWFYQRRPVVVGTVFSYDYPSSSREQRAISLEFYALRGNQVRLEHGERLLWETDGRQTNPPIVADFVGAPLSTPGRRLQQMRKIASAISAETVRGSTKLPLRLLSRPLYRFASTEADADSSVLDGAIFAMVTGTDPELLLVVEALRGDDGEAHWFVTPARFTDLRVNVKMRDEEVAQFESRSREQSYFCRQRYLIVSTDLGPEAQALIGDDAK